jgi:phage portal protein BeeE
MAGKAPPFDDAGKTSGTARATQAHEAAFRGRLGSTGVYKAPAGTGSSKAMPRSRCPHDSGRRLGGDSGPSTFKPIKT